MRISVPLPSRRRYFAMPIRFRCAYCNQLMGIARRKAGTVVSCPNCSGQVVVPTEDAVETSGSGPTAPPPGNASQPLFERGDFDDLFRSGKAGAPPPPPAPAMMPGPPLRQTAPPSTPSQQQAPLPPPPSLDFNPPPSPAPPPNGYVISSSMATLLSVALLVALALAFTAGLLVGRFYLQPSADELKPLPPEGHRLTAPTPRA